VTPIKNIAKVLFYIFCINILGLAVQTNAVVQMQEIGVSQVEGTSYTIASHRELKSEETTSSRNLMETTSLSTGEELITNAIADGIKNKQPQINLTTYIGYMLEANDALSLYFETLDKYPELFYTSGYISATYSNDIYGNLSKCTLNILYTVDISKIDSMVQTYNAKVSDIKTNYTNPSYGELENEYIVHDYILENCTYDRSVVIPEISHTAYGALVYGVAVCDGYAKAVKQLLNDCGIESGIVTNTAENHAWNYVKIEGQYYHLDVTWNDPVPETNESIYKYFNISDAVLKTVSNHSIPANIYPVATSNSFNFLRNNYSANRYYPKRIGDKLYYTVNNLGDLRSMDLNGTNDTLVTSGLEFYGFEGYKSKVYVNEIIEDPSTGNFINIITSYNLVSKELKTEYETDQYISDIYKKNSQLFIKTWDGNIDNISIDMKEDVDGDGVINIVDVAKAANSYNIAKNNTGYLSILDVNGDGIIDIYDITKISMQI
jgi:hypothetical protein